MFKSRHFIFVLIAVLFPLLTACTGATSPTPTPTDMPEGVTIVNPPGDPAVFALTDKSGNELTLADVEGKYTLFFFGYTNCPDFCPNTLANFLIVKQLLGDQAEDVNFMLISVDGKRDTPERLTEYTESFDPTFLAATGSDAVLSETVSQFGAHYELDDENDTLEDDYLVEHTTSSFLLDPEGRWIRLYSYGTDPQVMATDIGQLVDSTAASDA